MQTYSSGIVKEKTTEILSAPPRSGHISIYSEKLAAQTFVWLCCTVVWGNVINEASIRKTCQAHCGFQLAFAFIAWTLASIILFLNKQADSNPKNRNGCFSHGMEWQLTAVLIVLWIPPVISVSTFNAAPLVATWFSWLGFLSSMYATLKAYHSAREEDLPSDLPDGFDEEDYVYG